MKRSTSLISLVLGLLLQSVGCKSPDGHSGSDTQSVNMAGKQIGQLRGILTINNILSTRLMARPFDLVQHIHINQMFSEVTGQLGAPDGLGIKNRFGNGIPNAVNMLLWSTMIQNFSSQFTAFLCLENDAPGDDGSTKVYSEIFVNPEANSTFLNCGLSTNASPLKKNPQAIWTLLMQEDAPQSEFEVWLAWLKSPEFSRDFRTPQQQMAAAISGALLSPYFLLEH